MRQVTVGWGRLPDGPPRPCTADHVPDRSRQSRLESHINPSTICMTAASARPASASGENYARLMYPMFQTHSPENSRKNSALGCPTNDDLGFGRHFLSPNFGGFQKRGFFQYPLLITLIWV